MGQKKLSKRLAVISVLAVALTAAFLVWWFFIRQPPIPHNIIALSGRIEGDDSTVAAKTSGRIREIRVREGDVVKVGAVVALLDEEQAATRQEQAVATGHKANT